MLYFHHRYTISSYPEVSRRATVLILDRVQTKQLLSTMRFLYSALVASVLCAVSRAQSPVGYKQNIEIDGDDAIYKYDLWEGDSTCEQFQYFCDKDVPAGSCCSFCTYTEGEGGCILLKGNFGNADLTPLCVCDNPDPTNIGWMLGTSDLCPVGEQVVPECDAGLVSEVLTAKPSKYGGGYVSGAAVDSEDEDDYEDDALADEEAWSPPTANSPRGHMLFSSACKLGAVSVIALAFV